MCDTIAATGTATADGITLFGKNSDREPNEAQNLCHIPGQKHDLGASVKCTYISIPQVAKTNAVLLSKPFWMWGAEMGVNEHGLAIGNEAVFTRVPYEKGPALTGMDLLRLALERAATAQAAVHIITDLIQTFGQGGNCAYRHKIFYHNSFLLADPESVWVLETAGRHWAAKRVDGIYAISNKITLETSWDIASDDLVHFAVQKGWCRSAEDFSFARCYSDFLYTKFSSSEHRRARALTRLNALQGRLRVADFFAILRDHGNASPDSFCPDRGLIQSQICNHAGWGPVRISQTTGSLVSRLVPDFSTHFITGTAAPCTSLFKPIWVDTPMVQDKLPAGEAFDSKSLFWEHEMLHRLVLKDYQKSMQFITPRRDKLEAALLKQALSARKSDLTERQSVARQAFEKARDLDNECLVALKSLAVDKSKDLLYSHAWRKWNKAAGLPDS
ncbi:MAG: C69 family dipeptidase [Desulfobacterales bacterium]|jgi:secernin